jgi:hypothetical protein
MKSHVNGEGRMSDHSGTRVKERHDKMTTIKATFRPAAEFLGPGNLRGTWTRSERCLSQRRINYITSISAH